MSSCTALNLEELKKHPLPRVADGDKYAHGKLLVIAGTRDIAGSAMITATAAMRAGSGKVTIATVESAAPLLRMAVPEAMILGFAEGRDGGFAPSTPGKIAAAAANYDAVVGGPGMKASPVATALAKRLCATGRALVLDAALLRGLKPATHAARAAAVTPILLPNAGEMASLLARREEEVQRDPLDCGREAASRYNALVLAKGAESHIVAPDGRAWKYSGGGPGLGISGSGDTLAGIVGGLLTRGAEPLTALLWGVWLHGEAGAILAKKIGPVGFLAREISGEVPALLAKAQPSCE